MATLAQQAIAESLREAEHERRMEVVSDAAIACAKAVEAARLDEREQCAKIADRQAGQLTNGGAINASRAIAAAIRKR